MYAQTREHLHLTQYQLLTLGCFFLFTSSLQESLLQIECLCCYLSELSLLDYSCVKFLPSMLAASAVFLARFIIRPKQHPWVSNYDCFFYRDLCHCNLNLFW